MKKDVKIVLAGFYGCGNFGDDAILLALCRTLKKLLPEAHFTVLLGDDKAGKRMLEREGITFGDGKNDVRAVRRTSLSVLSAIRDSDVFVLGGGSLLQNTTGQASLYYYLGLLRFAMLLGKKTALLCGGYGKVRGEYAKDLTRRVLGRVDYLSFRDERARRSVIRLLNVGNHIYPEERVKLSSDPVLTLFLRVLNGEKRRPTGKYFLVVPRKRTGISPTDLAKTVTDLALKNEMSPVLLDLFPTEDAAFCSELYGHLKRRLGNTPYRPYFWVHLTVSSLLFLTRESSMVLTMRYHAALFAFSESVPFTVLGDDPKLVAIALERDAKAARKRVEEDLRYFASFLAE